MHIFSKNRWWLLSWRVTRSNSVTDEYEVEKKKWKIEWRNLEEKFEKLMSQNVQYRSNIELKNYLPLAIKMSLDYGSYLFAFY